MAKQVSMRKIEAIIARLEAFAEENKKKAEDFGAEVESYTSGGGLEIVYNHHYMIKWAVYLDAVSIIKHMINDN